MKRALIVAMVASLSVGLTPVAQATEESTVGGAYQEYTKTAPGQPRGDVKDKDAEVKRHNDKAREDRGKSLDPLGKAAHSAFGQSFVISAGELSEGIEAPFLWNGTGRGLGVVVVEKKAAIAKKPMSDTFRLEVDGHTVGPDGADMGRREDRVYRTYKVDGSRTLGIQYIKLDEDNPEVKKNVDRFYRESKEKRGDYEFWQIFEVYEMDKSQSNLWDEFATYMKWAGENDKPKIQHFDHFVLADEAMDEGKLDKYLPKRAQEKENALLGPKERFEVLHKGADDVDLSGRTVLYP